MKSSRPTVFLRVSSTLGGLYPELERINHAVQQEASEMSVEHLENIPMQHGLLHSCINKDEAYYAIGLYS